MTPFLDGFIVPFFLKLALLGVGGESERLAVLNLTETLIYLGAISLEINFLTASIGKTSVFVFYNRTQVFR
jgi:hypothetical protein